jgi:uncharacterized damage-inducible protein DinB
MTESDQKAILHRYLRTGREALVWKLDGLSEYDIRRPMTRTGTSLLGLVKHVATTELGYFSDVFDRPSDVRLPWTEGVDFSRLDELSQDVLMADMWATADESRELIVDLYRQIWSHSDATIDALALDARGQVPWWPPERREVTLQQILVHMTVETHRHAGHADIVREVIDGSAGMRPGDPNLPDNDQAWWTGYRDRVEHAAKAAQAPPHP